MRLDIDMTFSVADPGNGSGRMAKGTIRAAGREVQVYLDDPSLLPVDKMPALASVREMAKTLASRGLSVSVGGPQGELVSLGAVKASVAQRLVTGSLFIRLGSLRALAPLAGRFSRRETQKPSLLPPGTPWPLVPMVYRRIPRKITTTHYSAGGGRPRLIVVKDGEYWDGNMLEEFNLKPGTTTIGSSASADLVLDGLEPVHAEIHHTDTDEYVLHSHGPVGGSVDNQAETTTLRTGSRLVMGQWRLGFFREEYADHGRPHGGRSGGEFAHQKAQYNPRTGKVERDEI
ncbi:FHA domain-containing protein [Arthrobacter sp. H14]|uniref:FHA domain-containing protein n=1 Tax=Arthrobacter sp. H14 TaxID=1312959 RepID=UPI0004B4D81C|nr:FHA domain-containing protein [Arthrobacter sp. H14]